MKSHKITTSESLALRLAALYDASDSPLCFAARRGVRDDIRKLLAKPSLAGDVEKAMLICCAQGHEACLRILLTQANPRARKSFAIQLAAKHGRAQCVDLLIPISAPKADGSLALRWAIDHGHLACVKLLVPVSDPLGQREMSDIAKRGALSHKVHEVFTYLESLDMETFAREGHSYNRSPRRL